MLGMLRYQVLKTPLPFSGNVFWMNFFLSWGKKCYYYLNFEIFESVWRRRLDFLLFFANN